MRKNGALRKLQKGEPTFGFNVTIGSVQIAEYAAHLGLDWTWLDWQHGSWTEERLLSALSAYVTTGTVPLVRVRGHNPWEIGKVLDMGAMGVIIPMVGSAEEAEDLVKWKNYNPAGTRSAGGMRLSVLSENLDSADYFAHANEEIMLVVMIETVKAVERADEILSVEGVDCVMFGPGDLLMDIQAKGGDEKERSRLEDRVLEAGVKAGKPIGYPCGDLEGARGCLERGFRFIGIGVDNILIREQFKAMAETAKSWKV